MFHFLPIIAFFWDFKNLLFGNKLHVCSFSREAYPTDPQWAGVLAPPVHLKRSSLVRSLGSDHLPLVVDFGVVTPVQRLKPSKDLDALAKPADASVGATACESRMVEMAETLRRLESQMSTLSNQLGSQKQEGGNRELQWFLLASISSSVMLAAFAWLLGFNDRLV